MPHPVQAVDQTWQQAMESLNWYHTFDLPGGLTTVAYFDHRDFVTKLPIPSDLRGRRCLDVGSADGFFSFEMARRGAAEVVSVDLADLEQQDFRGPPVIDRCLDIHQGRANKCFEFVREATGLEIQRVDGSIYDIAELGLGHFDFVFVGNLLLHLKDPIRALEATRQVTRGELLSVEPISMTQTVLRPWTPTGTFGVGHDNIFWIFNLKGHRSLVEAGGFEVSGAGRPILQPLGRSVPRWPTRRTFPKSPRELTNWLLIRPFGKATSWVTATPAEVRKERRWL